MIPFLILSDSPTGSTGLGRITRQLAERISKMRTKDSAFPDAPLFHVGVVAVSPETPGVDLPFPVYHVDLAADYSPTALPYVWKEHCRKIGFHPTTPGILMTVMNAMWLGWLAAPESLPFGELRDFLMTNPFKKWAYVPVDAEGPEGKLMPAEAFILSKMDRVLAYTEFGSRVIGDTLEREIDHLPHGTDTSIFYPRDKNQARLFEFGKRILLRNSAISEDTLLLSCIATNTARKDWPLAFEILREISKKSNVGMWAHTNKMEGYWNLAAMAKAFGVIDKVIFTTHNLSEEDTAWGYAASDAVLCIGKGEGWSMTGSESLACGVPPIHGFYAGQVEYMPKELLVSPSSFYYEGFHSSKRPTFNAVDWVNAIYRIRGDREPYSLDHKFTWNGCWPQWEKWIEEGL